jgi:PAT family beta-lactamase induction signal transducer AmpG
LPLLIRERPTDQYLAWPFSKNGERDRPGGPSFESVHDVVGQIVDTFRRSRESILALLALLAAVPTRMMVTFGPVFTVQSLGWSDAWYSQFAGGLALVASGVGAVLGGWLADQTGRRRVVCGALMSILSLFLLFALCEPWWSATGVVVVFFLLGMFADMVLRMTLQALYMATTREDVMATQFTIYMTLGNMSNVLASLLITPLDALFSPQIIFLWSAAFGVIPLLLLYWLPAPFEEEKEKAASSPSTTSN